MISSSDEGVMKKLKHFAIQKGLIGLAGEIQHVTKLNLGHCWSSIQQRNIQNVFSSRLHLPMCTSKCRHIPPLIHQRELLKKRFITRCYCRQENKGPTEQ